MSRADADPRGGGVARPPRDHAPGSPPRIRVVNQDEPPGIRVEKQDEPPRIRVEKQDRPPRIRVDKQDEPPRIRVGVGGWTYEPWRDNFYPAKLPHARELEYASRRLTAIEINGTYYSTQKPASFAKWRDETPDDFVFSMKASRYATNRRVLAEAGESIERFVGSGIAELGPKLGPIVWQFAPTKRFDPDDFDAFLRLLPAGVEGLPLRHVLDVRHDSFRCADYLALARRHRVATVFTDSDDYPSFADVTGDFVYLRMMRTRSDLPEGCEPQVLSRLADCARVWRDGGEPSGLPRVEAEPAAPAAARNVFCYFISGAKEKAPAAAMALRRALGETVAE